MRRCVRSFLGLGFKVLGLRGLASRVPDAAWHGGDAQSAS